MKKETILKKGYAISFVFLGIILLASWHFTDFEDVLTRGTTLFVGGVILWYLPEN